MTVFRAAAVVPVYNHAVPIGRIVGGLLAHGLPCILVDDGSDAPCADELARLAAAWPERVILVRHAENAGKGAAMLTGFAAAAAEGFTHALQIDADGQHAVEDVPRFLELARSHPDALIAGTPIYDASVPKHRLYLRYLTHVMVSVNTLNPRLRDSMCGFRIYPLAPTITLMQRARIGRRMDFDTDMMVRLDWMGVPIVEVPTRVRYPEDGVSHFRLWGDNVRLTWMQTRLFFGMLVRAPGLLRSRHARNS